MIYLRAFIPGTCIILSAYLRSFAETKGAIFPLPTAHVIQGDIIPGFKTKGPGEAG